MTSSSECPSKATAADCVRRAAGVGYAVSVARRSFLWREWMRVAVSLLSWGYFGLVLITLAFVQLSGDRWWLATLVLFSPRVLFGLPLLVLTPAALMLRRRALWPLAAAAVLWIVPFMGLRMPLIPTGVAGFSPLRVITLNIGQDRVDPEELKQLVRRLDADLVMLQECPDEYPAEWPADWHVHRAGQLVIAARYRLDVVGVSHRALPPSRWLPVNGLLVRAHLPSGEMDVACVHLTSPREGLAEVLDRRTGVSFRRAGKVTENLATRRAEASALADWLARSDRPLLIAGDFNMPLDSRIFRESWSRFHNAFSEVGFGFGHTKFEPLGPFEYGIRIDHVLGAEGCQFARCWVGPDLGSDHRPLIADAVLFDR